MSVKIVFVILLLHQLNLIAQNVSVNHDSAFYDQTHETTLPVIYFANGDESESSIQEQDASVLLQSSRDVFVQFSSFQFSAARFRLRGYASENQTILMNGIHMMNLENGISSWSNWGGLNDVTRYSETRIGNTANRYSSSGAGGYINIDSKASGFKKGTRVSYGTANRNFRQRIMLTLSSGLMKNGWAVTFSASTRWGEKFQIPGTYVKAYSFYLSLDKKINRKQLLSLTSFVSPVERGNTSSTTMEVYELTHSPYYNSNWGYQNGQLRNANISKSAHPCVFLNHFYTPSLNKRLQSSLYVTFGKTSRSNLNFYNAENPRPDYYKYLPSFYYINHDTLNGDNLKTDWLEDFNTRQINWDKLIAANQANLYTVPDEIGEINTTETRSRYILENSVESMNQAGMNLIYNERKGNVYVSAGMNAAIQQTRKFKVMEDLLGGSFWMDVDQFASDLGIDPSVEQNDIEHPNKKIVQGAEFGYNYYLHVNKAEVWAQTEYSIKKIDCYGGMNVSKTTIWREGLYANGKFPENSKGESAHLNYTNYGFKAGITYKLSGRNFIGSNLQIQSRAPKAANTFISPKVRNDVVDDLKNEELIAFDLNYLAKYAGFKFRCSIYSTQINNQTNIKTYWSDEYNNTVNMIMTSINQRHQGIELGLDKTIFLSHSVLVAVGLAQSYYTNQPKLQAWQDNNNQALYFNRRVYLKNYRLGNSPQLVSGIGYKYSGKKYWLIGINFNYVDQLYIEPNPDRRTDNALSKFQSNEKTLADKISEQEKLPAYYYININSSKSFRFSKKYSFSVQFSINNLLNNTNAITNGYEQLRWSQTQLDKFPNKYNYMSGISYMLLLNFSF